MLCKENSPINFFIIEIDSGQVWLIRSMSLYVTRKGDILLRVNLSKVDSRECILLAVADKKCGRMSPHRKNRSQCLVDQIQVQKPIVVVATDRMPDHT